MKDLKRNLEIEIGTSESQKQVKLIYRSRHFRGPATLHETTDCACFNCWIQDIPIFPIDVSQAFLQRGKVIRQNFFIYPPSELGPKTHIVLELRKPLMDYQRVSSTVVESSDSIAKKNFARKNALQILHSL